MWLVWFAGLLVSCLAGCDTPERRAEADAARRIRPDPTLLDDRTASLQRTECHEAGVGHAAEIAGAVTLLPWMPGEWVKRKSNPGEISWKLETGSIVEQALLHTFSATIGGESASLPTVPEPASGYSGTLELVSVQFDYEEDCSPSSRFWFRWVEFEVRTRMTMQTRLFDAQGQTVWHMPL